MTNGRFTKKKLTIFALPFLLLTLSMAVPFFATNANAATLTSGNTLTEVSSGLAARDPLTASNGVISSYWTLAGDAGAEGIPFSTKENSSGLYIGIDTPSSAVNPEWAGFYAESPNSTVMLFHTTLTLPYATIASGSFNTGLYVQTDNGLINYVTCAASVGPTGYEWAVVLAQGNTQSATSYMTLYSQSGGPLTQSCTIVTNGSNLLKVYLSNQLVFSSTTMTLNMPEPFNSYLEVEASSANANLFGKYTDYYATLNDNLVVNNVPSGYTVELVSSSNSVLATTTATSTGSVTLQNLGIFDMPIAASLEVFDAAHNLVATTGSSSFWGGDVYALSLSTTTTSTGSSTSTSPTTTTTTAPTTVTVTQTATVTVTAPATTQTVTSTVTSPGQTTTQTTTATATITSPGPTVTQTTTVTGVSTQTQTSTVTSTVTSSGPVTTVTKTGPTTTQTQTTTQTTTKTATAPTVTTTVTSTATATSTPTVTVTATTTKTASGPTTTITQTGTATTTVTQTQTLTPSTVTATTTATQTVTGPTTTHTVTQSGTVTSTVTTPGPTTTRTNTVTTTAPGQTTTQTTTATQTIIQISTVTVTAATSTQPTTSTTTSTPTTTTTTHTTSTTAGPSIVILQVVNQNGQAITGYWAVLYDSKGALAATGFSPITFPGLTPGTTYSIAVVGFGSCTFSHWQDNGNTNNLRSFTAVSGTQTFTAVFNCSNIFGAPASPFVASTGSPLLSALLASFITGSSIVVGRSQMKKRAADSGSDDKEEENQ